MTSRKDQDPLVGLDELARLLEAHDGPAGARARPHVARSGGLRRTGLVAAGTLALGGAVGFALASSLTPSGSAASRPAGLGFVPSSGWTVIQSGADASPTRPAIAIASNVPLARSDDARGIRRSSGLPYATLLDLPSDGVVIVATFSLPPGEDWLGDRFPVRETPLRLRDATPFFANSTQIRPERPLGEYALKANVNGRDVDLHFYFGRRAPSIATVTAAQGQLDRLVVEPTTRPIEVEERALPLRSTGPSANVAAANVVDRTFACKTGAGRGARTVDVNALSGFRKGGRFEWLGQLIVSTPGQPIPSRPGYEPTLVGLTAGWPPSPPLTSGSLGYSIVRCTPSRARVPLTRRGLGGGVASRQLSGDEVKCYAPVTVLIRVRASFFGTAKLVRTDDRTMLQAIARIRTGQVAVRTPNGKALLYGEVDDSGTARLFSARSCF